MAPDKLFYIIEYHFENRASMIEELGFDSLAEADDFLRGELFSKTISGTSGPAYTNRKDDAVSIIAVIHTIKMN